MKAPRKRFPPNIYRKILVEQDWRCACPCRGVISGSRDIQWDHKLPIWLGGKDEPENLQALKRGHHQRKTDRETAARAKVKRIIAQDGLRLKKESERDKVLAKVLAR